MSESELARLRDAFLEAPESGATRIVAIVGSAALVATVLWLVRSRRLREEYTPIWLGVAFAILAVSLHFELLRAVTRAIGAWTPSSTIFFLGEIFLLAICLNFAVRLSRTSAQVKTLTQEIALLRAERDEPAAPAPGPGTPRGPAERRTPPDPRAHSA